MGVGVQYEVLVSDRVRIDSNMPGHILTLAQRPIFKPDAERFWPGQYNLKRHRKTCLPDGGQGFPMKVEGCQNRWEVRVTSVQIVCKAASAASSTASGATDRQPNCTCFMHPTIRGGASISMHPLYRKIRQQAYPYRNRCAPQTGTRRVIIDDAVKRRKRYQKLYLIFIITNRYR